MVAPAVGAQGATPEGLATRFAGVHGLVLPAVSRSLLPLGPDSATPPEGANRWRQALDAALPSRTL